MSTSKSSMPQRIFIVIITVIFAAVLVLWLNEYISDRASARIFGGITLVTLAVSFYIDQKLRRQH